MAKPENAGNGSWWTTLPGVLTGLAAVVTALGALVGALHQAHLLPSFETHSTPPSTPSPETPRPESNSVIRPGLPAVLPNTVQQVEGVGVRVGAVRRRRDKEQTFVELDYTVITGQQPSWHDPPHFVKLVSGVEVLKPVWASASASDLQPNSRQSFLVRFPPPRGDASIVLRFGEEHYLDLLAKVED